MKAWHRHPRSSPGMLDDLKEAKGVWVYADGGMIGPGNPSIGGTIAYRVVVDGEVVVETARVFGIGKEITNNVSEMYAALMGIAAAGSSTILEGFPSLSLALIQSMPEGSVRLVSDSAVALGRLTGWYRKMDGLPEEFVRLVAYARRVLSAAYQVKGHPSNKRLLEGVSKCGAAVSAHQHWCDVSAKAAGEEYLSKTKGPE